MVMQQFAKLWNNENCFEGSSPSISAKESYPNGKELVLKTSETVSTRHEGSSPSLSANIFNIIMGV